MFWTNYKLLQIKLGKLNENIYEVFAKNFLLVSHIGMLW
jgi:hypothetical protein